MYLHHCFLTHSLMMMLVHASKPWMNNSLSGKLRQMIDGMDNHLPSHTGWFKTSSTYEWSGGFSTGSGMGKGRFSSYQLLTVSSLTTFRSDALAFFSAKMTKSSSCRCFVMNIGWEESDLAGPEDTRNIARSRRSATNLKRLYLLKEVQLESCSFKRSPLCVSYTQP